MTVSVPSDAVLWRAIEAVRAARGAKERLAALRRALKPLPHDERAAFHAAAHGWHAALDRESLWMAAVAMMGFCSDDGFHYFREWLLLQGRVRVEGAVHDPDSMADWNVTELPSAEGLLGAAELWPGELTAAHDVATFRPDTSTWPSDVRPDRDAPLVEAECAIRFPRLWASANDVASRILTLVERGEWATSQRVADALVSANVGAPGLVLFLQGVIAYERADWSAAVAFFREAERAQPRSPSLAFSLAEALYRDADANAAPAPVTDAEPDAEAIFAFFERRPREHEAIFRRAMELRRAGATTPIDDAAQRLSGMLRIDWERAEIFAA